MSENMSERMPDARWNVRYQTGCRAERQIQSQNNCQVKSRNMHQKAMRVRYKEPRRMPNKMSQIKHPNKSHRTQEENTIKLNVRVIRSLEMSQQLSG